ncbi:hypothetical protein V6N13_123217 [Hibiscus sabdariffa]
MTYKIEIPRLEFPLPHRTPTAAVAMLFSLVLVTVVVVGDTRPTTSHRVSATSETRLKWTVVLHERFVGCVNLLGGSEIEQLFMVEYNI